MKGGAPVFEVNPGLGFISRGLLAAGIQRLWLCESAVSFAQQMKVKILDRVLQKLIVTQLRKFPIFHGT